MTTTPTKPRAESQAQPPAAGASDEATTTPVIESPATPQDSDQLAVIYNPELNEPTLQTCRGGSLVWAFGPVTNPTTLRINPGLNAPVPRDLWEKAKLQAETLVLMGRGQIQEIELTGGAALLEGEISLAAVPLPVAHRLIYGCRDTERLRLWLRKEDRQPLRAKLAERIKEIEDGRP
jgi:hypothetical protein